MDDNKQTMILHQTDLEAPLMIDFPLFALNPESSVRIYLADLSNQNAQAVVKEVIGVLFRENFYLCDYGRNSNHRMINNRIVSRHCDFTTIPFRSKNEDDYFEYMHKAITYTYIKLNDLNLNKYIRYAFSSSFISNTLFLVDLDHHTALNVYDRRGMDIASIDKRIVEQIKEKYKELIKV